jgi:hypothetical protein
MKPDQHSLFHIPLPLCPVVLVTYPSPIILRSTSLPHSPNVDSVYTGFHIDRAWRNRSQVRRCHGRPFIPKSTSHISRGSETKKSTKVIHGPAIKGYLSIILSTLSWIPLRGSPVLDPVLSVSALQPAFLPFSQALGNRRNAIGPVLRPSPYTHPRFFGGTLPSSRRPPCQRRTMMKLWTRVLG